MNRSKIILIDDDRDFLDTMAIELEAHHFNVYTCSTLESLKEITLNLATPDFAIVDLRIGRESGLSIIPFLRKKYPNIHITMLTAFGSIASTVEAMKIGCNNYLMKPCSIDELISALDHKNSNTSVEENSPKVPNLYRKEREYIEYVLQLHAGNISQTAQALGIKRQSLQRKLKKYMPKS